MLDKAKILSLRTQLVLLVGIFLVGISLLFTNNMANNLREKEQYDVELWAHALERMTQDVVGRGDSFAADIVSSRQNIPFIMTDDELNVVESHLIPDNIINHPDRLRVEIERLAEENQPIRLRFMWNERQHILFYGRSVLLKRLYYFPYVQIAMIIIFLTLCYIAFSSSKYSEQNRVWVGLAKETAHQLGTPTSSLLGWVEYLRTQPIDQEVVEEINKDLSHLTKIIDRFSKIGSDTPLTPVNINEVVGESVMYFRKRVPRNVKVEYNGLCMAPIEATINTALFEWVVENLMKNALDALQGQGVIEVRVAASEQNVTLEVKDSGKGIPKGDWKRIFEPGFTTKTRGWGLGLSLSRRIVEEFHHGKIAVVESELGRGTTFRITLKRSDEL